MLEIGPGRGALTALLAPRVRRVVAIERDVDLISDLERTLPGVEIVEGDALTLDWTAVVGETPYLIIGNIPYNITTPLIEKALTPPRAPGVVFLVQREVGERVAATPGTKAYGALSVGVQAVARPETIFAVPARAFHPPPKVDSVVLRLTPLDHPLVDNSEIDDVRRVVTGLFGARRKQLQRSVRQLTQGSREDVMGLLDDLGIDPQVRAESLDPPTLVALARVLVDRSRTSG